MWWLEKTIDMFERATFSLSEYMSGRRFQNIGTAIYYTNIESPAFLDWFHDVRQMIEAFNDHYEDEYIPSWLNCLDDSMNSFLDKFFPGFVCVPRKPHPFGNEYHSIANGVTEKGLEGNPIMWRVKLQEEKDRPKKPDGGWAFPSEFPGYSKTAMLMLEMTNPVQHTGKVVSMDSGFCVSVRIIAMHNFGVYGQSLIKKQS